MSQFHSMQLIFSESQRRKNEKKERKESKQFAMINK